MWQNNKTQLIVEEDVAIDSNIDFPAITICNNFPVDRWGFLRDLLNLAKYECNGYADCTDTERFREHIQIDWYNDHGFAAQLTDREFARLFVIHNGQEYPGQYMWQDYFFKGNIKLYFHFRRMLGVADDEDVFYSYENQMNELKDLFLEKFSGRLNNYDLYDRFGISSNETLLENIKDFESFTQSNGQESSILNMLILLFIFPTPGSAGTMISTMPHITGYGLEVPHFKLQEYFSKITNNMDSVRNVNVSLFDIPVIFEPSFVIPREMFSVNSEYMNVNQRSDLSSRGRRGNPLTSEGTKYFGQLFSSPSRILTVMEIMSHCILRVGLQKAEKFHELTEVYPPIEKLLDIDPPTSKRDPIRVKDYIPLDGPSYGPTLLTDDGIPWFDGTRDLSLEHEEEHER